MKDDRRRFMFGMALATSSREIAAFAGGESKALDWDQVLEAAANYVGFETPAAALCWNLAPRHEDRRRVFAHYMPVFPLSFSTTDWQLDYYNKHYLRADGENGKFSAVGGFLRDAPLPLNVHYQQGREEFCFALEILRAQAIGIDAFGVDILGLAGSRPWARTAMLLQVAERLAGKFTIFPELDMVALASSDIQAVAAALQHFSSSPAATRANNGELLVMPFAAERKPPEYWADLIKICRALGFEISLVLDFVDHKNHRAYAGFASGMSLWGSRGVTAGEHARVTLNRMREVVGAVAFPVAPQDFRPKTGLLWEPLNTEAYRNSWIAAIASDSEMIHLITWNDYSESSHISPSINTRFVFYDLASYYIHWYKTGSPPPIVRNGLIYSHRAHLLNSSFLQPAGLLHLAGAKVISNDLEVLSFLNAPGSLTVRMGLNNDSFSLLPGVHSSRVPLAAVAPEIGLVAGGVEVANVRSRWPVTLPDPSERRLEGAYYGDCSLRLP